MDSHDDLIARAAARFAADCGALLDTDAPLGIAVSGGPDSLALLMLAHRAFAGQMMAATVDHRLRPESAEEAAMVAALCARHGIAHETLAVSVAPGNVQANAREARYRALGDWARRGGIGAVATAHHADDQAETLLMRLNRGAGLKGLAAMRARRPMPGSDDVTLIRPLLQWRRSELTALCDALALNPASDPSNSNPHYDRARIRAAMADADWLDPAQLAVSARHLRDAFEALEATVDAEVEDRVAWLPADHGVIYRPAPRERGAHGIRFRVLERLLARLGRSNAPPRGAEIDRLLATLESGGIATLGGMRFAADGPPDAPEWRLTREPSRKSG